MLALISIREVMQELRYKDIRSARKFLDRKNIAMKKVGKEYCILKEDFENLIQRTVNDMRSRRRKNFRRNTINESKPEGKYSGKFLQNLHNFLDEL
jgi:hypothetical protein